MKPFNALTAIVVVAIGSTVWADDPAPVENVPQSEAQQYVEADQFDTVDGVYYPPVPSGAYSDFPGYYPGYTSYRGMGFMGSCCEQPSCCAQNAWDGYCQPEAYGRQSLFHGWKDKLHSCLPKLHCPTICWPSVKACDAGCGQKGCDSGCGQKDCLESTSCGVKPCLGLHHLGWKRPACGVKGDCCDPCCEEVGGKCEVVAPTWQGKLRHKLHGLRGDWGGLWQGAPANVDGKCCGPVEGNDMWMQADKLYQEATPVPEPTFESNDEPTAEPPQPTVTTDFSPDVPDLNTQDRSAWRKELHRLPDASMSF